MLVGSSELLHELTQYFGCNFFINYIFKIIYELENIKTSMLGNAYEEFYMHDHFAWFTNNRKFEKIEKCSENILWALKYRVKS